MMMMMMMMMMMIQSIDTGTRELDNKRMSGDYPYYTIIKID